MLAFLTRAWRALGAAVPGLPHLVVPLAALVLLCLVALGALRRHDADVRRLALVSDSLHRAEVRATYWEWRRGVVDTVVRRESVRVTRTVTRLDTLWRAVPDSLTTAADTTAALVALPRLRAASDSVVRACTALQRSCADYRRATDSLLALQAERIRLLISASDAERPGTLARAWNRARFPAGVVVGLVVGRWIAQQHGAP